VRLTIIPSLFGAYLFAARCMEHSLHLAAKHFVQAVAPSSPRTVTRKVKKAFDRATKNGDLDLDSLDRELVGFSFDDGDDESEDSDDDDVSGFDVGDSLGKALALVNQVYYFIFLSISIALTLTVHY
jgi:hypothetical protein